MWWSNPFWLPALLLIIPIIKLGRFPMQRWSSHGAPGTIGDSRLEKQDHNLTRLTLLRVLTVSAVVLALAGTTIMLPSNQRQLIFLIDVSSSVGSSRVETARTTALRLIGQLKPKDRVAVASFAGEPHLIIPFSAPNNAVSVLAGADLSVSRAGATDLQAALRLGKELLSETHGDRRILLFSDGRPTVGGPINMVLQSLKGIPVDVIPIGMARTGLFAGGLDLPENVHPNEPVLGYWKIENDKNQTVSIRVKIDDRIISKKNLSILAGQNSVPLQLPGQKTGTYRVTVEAFDNKGNPLPGANTGAVFQVRGPARVLVISDGVSSSPVGKALRNQGMDVEFGAIKDLPESLLGLTGYGSMVLDNVPALYLTEDQQTTIQNYVAGGGGLLVVGGDSSLGRGEYYATGLEDLLPVETDTRKRLLFTRANILFVIDHSGSMSEMVGNTSKQLAAMQGVMGAIKELNPVDEVGILAFDTSPTWVLPFTPVSEEAAIGRSISEIGQGGGTDITTALEEISKGFQDRGPVRRHTVILTDGLTASGNFKELVERLKTAGVSVTTIGIGEEIDEKLLRNIAAWGDGQFYRADLDQIPKTILKETVRVTRDLIQEGIFRVKVRTQGPLLEGLDRGLPPVNGYLITKPKNMATVYLETVKKDPLLAAWRYGSGQVAVFTSDSGSRWLSGWAGTSYYNLLWSQLIRTIERGSSDTGLRVQTVVEAGNAIIEVEATGPDRRLRTGLQLLGTAAHSGETFNLRETAPGHYQASIPLEGTGLQTFQIQERLGGEPAIGWTWNQQGEEMQIFEPDLSMLGRIASAGGGKIYSADLKSLPKASWAWKQAPLQNLLIIVALLLFLIELGYRSTSLGQMRMAQALLEAWWAAQARLTDLMRGFTFKDDSATRERQKVNDAYRYLAERVHRSKEANEKHA